MGQIHKVPIQDEHAAIRRIQNAEQAVKIVASNPDAHAQALNLTKLAQTYQWVAPEVLISMTMEGIQSDSKEAYLFALEADKAANNGGE